MKFIFLFFALLSLSLCDPPKINKLIAVEDAFVNVKKNILECISKSETASAELKKYATDLLATDLKESLNRSSLCVMNKSISSAFSNNFFISKIISISM